MTEREMILIRIALSYMIANLSDACDSFQCENEKDQLDGKIDYNGNIVDAPTENEIDKLMKQFQI